MSDVPALSIVLPCYNESGNIPLIYSRFREVLDGRTDVEVLLVDNGSTDDSAEIIKAEQAKQENSFARVVTVELNRGYGFGIMAGVREARGEVIAWTHADMQTDPNDVLLGHEKMLQGDIEKTFLKGKRIARNVFDAFFTFGMSLISSMALGAKLFDVNAQPKMFHRSFLEKMVNVPDDFSLDLYVLYLARKLDMTLIEQSVSFADRQHGESKGGGTLAGKFKLVKRTWKYIFELKRQLENVKV